MLISHLPGSDAIRILSTLRNNLERCPYSRGDPGTQPAVASGDLSGPWAVHYRARWLTCSHIRIPAGGLGPCSRERLAPVLPSDPKVQPKLDVAITTPLVFMAWARGRGSRRGEHTNTHKVELSILISTCLILLRLVPLRD